jgi:subtilase family serine protease
MKTMPALLQQKWLRGCGLRAFGWFAACAMAASTLGAQSAASRISSEINSSEISPMQGSRHPLAQPEFDAGRVPANMRLTGMTIAFNLSAAQKADLEALMAAQKNPASPLFHQWITPDQYAARFGMAQADLDKVQNWLLQQGFSVDWVARSRNMIRFSGTVSQAERAFSTEMHYYNAEGTRHLAPSTNLQIPSALAPVVLAVRGLDDFKPKAQVVVHRDVRPRASFTSGQTGNVYFSPGDIATAYDVTPLYNPGGFNGAGQSIAVVGQSAVILSDIEAFQSAASLPIKDPTLVLVPASGAPTIYSNDETESDLDLEWAGAMAPGADIFFVYTGDSQNSNGTFDAISYAIDQKIADIVSVSYGACEPTLNGFSLESSFMQASVQGQTVVAASGDQGSTACYVSPTTTNPTQAIQQELAVSYPASSPNVTAVGGTEIQAIDGVDPSTGTKGANYSTYWNSTSGTDIVASLKQYIPEVAWNDDSSAGGLSATGGGKSTIFLTKPTWQAALTPNDGVRDVPDISFYASGGFPGYLYCTSDTTSWSTQQQGSCDSGFRDSVSGLLTVAGGTSFAAPIFAGMLALINQKAGYTTGSGEINSTLYSLATSGGAYSAGTLFHDVTTGNNECTAGSTYCSAAGAGSYSAGTGYDLVTGLGSIDAANLAAAWATRFPNASPLVATVTTVVPANATPTVSTSDSFTITVKTAAGAPVTTGTVSLVVDGGTPTAGNALDQNGQYVYSTSFSSVGTHQVIAHYSGDGSNGASTGVGSVYIGGTFKLTSSPSPLNVTQGSSGIETITITPAGGYTGTVLLTLATSSSSALANLCVTAPSGPAGTGSVAVTTGAAQVQLTFNTLPSSCGMAIPNKGNPQLRSPGNGRNTRSSGKNPAPIAMAFAGLLLIGFMGRYARRFSTLAGLVALLAIGISLTACGGGGGGGGGGTTVTPDPPKGTYTVMVSGTDSVSAAIPASTTTFTFVIQ